MRHAFDFAWPTLKKRFGLFTAVLLTILAAWVVLEIVVIAGQRFGILLWVVVHLAFLIFVAVVELGLLQICRALSDGKVPTFADTFARLFLGPKFLAAQILYLLVVVIGLLLLVVPGVYESVWQLCCLGEFLVISMIHLHSSEVVARCGLDFLCAGYFQWGLSRHMRVRFNAVVARANSAATFLSPRIRNLRIPRCSFKIPMTGSASAFRRRYNARPVVAANLLRMRRRAG